MNIKLTPHLRSLLVSGAIALIVVLVAIGLDWYLFTLIQGRAAMLVGSKEATVALELKQAALLKERDRAKELGPSITQVESAFVNAGDPLRFIESLENLAKLDAVTIKLGLPQKKDFTLTMRLEAEGRPQDILVFMHSVESLPEQVIFENVTYEKLTEKTILPSPSPKGKTATPVSQARIDSSIEFLAK